MKNLNKMFSRLFTKPQSQTTYTHLLQLRWIALILISLGAALPSSALADEGMDFSTDPLDADAPRTWTSRLIGEPAPNRIYLGMWSSHFLDSDTSDTRETHHLIGITYEGYFAGTFINSYNDRVWSAGFHRKVAHAEWGALQLEAGYRAGLMYGYDEQLTYIAGKTPIFPVFQVTLDGSLYGVGVQASWAGSVFAVGFSIAF